MSDDKETARLIAYHDTVACSPYCHDDISTYPIPPEDWRPPSDALLRHDLPHL